MWPISSKLENALWHQTEFRGKLPRKNRAAAVLPAALLLGSGVLLAVAGPSNQVVPRFQQFSDPDGAFANLNLGGPTDTTTNPFFQDMGTNGRRCVTCHQASDAW